MLFWDVNNGISRRSWARNEGAMHAIAREMGRTPSCVVTMPVIADDDLIRKAIEQIITPIMAQHIISNAHLTIERVKEIIINHEAARSF